MTRNGTIRIYRIIKWINFIQKWDFYKIFIRKKARIFLYLAKIGGAKFPKILLRNATRDDDFFCQFEAKKIIIFSKLHGFMQNLVKNHDQRHPTWVI